MTFVPARKQHTNTQTLAKKWHTSTQPLAKTRHTSTTPPLPKINMQVHNSGFGPTAAAEGNEGVGFGVQGLGLGFRVQGLGLRLQGLGLRVQGLGLTAQGPKRQRWRFRVQGLGFRSYCPGAPALTKMASQIAGTSARPVWLFARWPTGLGFRDQFLGYRFQGLGCLFAREPSGREGTPGGKYFTRMLNYINLVQVKNKEIGEIVQLQLCKKIKKLYVRNCAITYKWTSWQN